MTAFRSGRLFPNPTSTINPATLPSEGTNTVPWEVDPNLLAPVEKKIDGFDVLLFAPANDIQSVFASITVPEQYFSKQIFIKKGAFVSENQAGDALLKCETILIRKGVTVLGVYPNQHGSNNVEVNVAIGDVNKILEIGDIDLTDGVGEINGVAVLPGDTLLVRLYRDYANETVPIAGNVEFLKDSQIVVFN